jgi:hypothetical protein
MAREPSTRAFVPYRGTAMIKSERPARSAIIPSGMLKLRLNLGNRRVGAAGLGIAGGPGTLLHCLGELDSAGIAGRSFAGLCNSTRRMPLYLAGCSFLHSRCGVAFA